MFKPKPLIEDSQLTKPIQEYDPTKTVAQNMAGQGNPNAQNVTSAYQTPQAQLQLQTKQPAGVKPAETKPVPVVNPASSTDGMNVLQSILTTPEQEEKMRRASVANQKIIAIADALRHIGNIYNTTNYAPAQQFNNPMQEEYDRYEKGRALRDAANMRYMTYQQQKAAQDAQMKRVDAQIKKQEADAARNDRIAEARISRMNQQNAKDTAWQAYYETRARLLEEGAPLERANKEAQIALRNEQARLAKIKADQGGFAPKKGSSGSGGKGGKYWAYDENGKIHYYPNKSMYEQGVYEFSKGQDTSETYNKGNDAFGKPQTGVRKRAVTSMGGERARQAKRKQLPGKSNSGKKKLPNT